MTALKEYHFEIGPMDDSSQCVAIVGAEYSSVSEDEAFYAKEDVVSALAEKDAEIHALKQKLMPHGTAKDPAIREKWHYRFEDLKPVTGRDIDMGQVDGEGCLDPNDEYYPRQKVDAAICELDAHRLCFDTDRKYYLKQYDYFLKKSMAYENRLLHSNYRRSCRIAKNCHWNLLEWQYLCAIVHTPEALKAAKAKVALWTKWKARWQAIAEQFR